MRYLAPVAAPLSRPNQAAGEDKPCQCLLLCARAYRHSLNGRDSGGSLRKCGMTVRRKQRNCANGKRKENAVMAMLRISAGRRVVREGASGIAPGTRPVVWRSGALVHLWNVVAFGVLSALDNTMFVCCSIWKNADIDPTQALRTCVSKPPFITQEVAVTAPYSRQGKPHDLNDSDNYLRFHFATALINIELVIVVGDSQHSFSNLESLFVIRQR
jgi:hypothetical protein